MSEARGHLVIAGPGRSGTTFLLKWLEACGLDVGEFGPDHWHEEARVGFERHLTGEVDLPFVVKDPWLWTYLDEVDPAWIDLLVVPLRHPAEAALSRLSQEWADIQGKVPGWRTEVFGRVPGGALYSLNVADQMRLDGLGFYTLAQWAVSQEVPMVLLDFERMVKDPCYLISMLDAWLPSAVRASEVYEEVAVQMRRQ